MLGPKRRNDRFQPNKKRHSGLSESFNGLGGTIVPG